VRANLVCSHGAHALWERRTSARISATRRHGWLLTAEGYLPDKFFNGLRSRVGERVRWYQTPEEVGH
jgi:hypothetical protein